MTHDKLQCGKSESSLRQKVVSDECGIMPKQRLFTGRLHPEFISLMKWFVSERGRPFCEPLGMLGRYLYSFFQIQGL